MALRMRNNDIKCKEKPSSIAFKYLFHNLLLNMTEILDRQYPRYTISKTFVFVL